MARKKSKKTNLLKVHNETKQILITDGMRKKYGVCEHDQVSYKALDKMCKDLLLHCKRLSRDIDRKGRMMELWMNNRKLWTEKINADLKTWHYIILKITIVRKNLQAGY